MLRQGKSIPLVFPPVVGTGWTSERKEEAFSEYSVRKSLFLAAFIIGKAWLQEIWFSGIKGLILELGSYWRAMTQAPAPASPATAVAKLPK